MDGPIKRRTAIKAVAAGLMLGLPAAQAQAVKVVELARLTKDWDAVEFNFGVDKAVLVRIPKPAKEAGRVLEVKQGGASLYLAAHLRVCTHQGCITPLPDANHQMVCPCHESTYRAEDGSVVSGPAPRPLRGIRLEVRGAEVWATGLMEQ
ncbi:MAG: Rieske (2Fe-2S) protein [Meiothermus sp.]|nr:Rieske (2Fe-2S) protein [Meiothermus sp.]